mmetsp:Transcript_18686/g.26169  ORF Transcript_18686/g.26169 Transcript_18686/m.26169 type:complete len:176 (-) Transcript_18686:108-635(-)
MDFILTVTVFIVSLALVLASQRPILEGIFCWEPASTGIEWNMTFYSANPTPLLDIGLTCEKLSMSCQGGQSIYYCTGHFPNFTDTYCTKLPLLSWGLFWNNANPYGRMQYNWYSSIETCDSPPFFYGDGYGANYTVGSLGWEAQKDTLFAVYYSKVPAQLFSFNQTLWQVDCCYL